MWEPNILTNLLDFEPHISPEKYAFFSSKILLVVVIEELTDGYVELNLMAYSTINQKTCRRFKPTLVITF